MKLEDYLKLNEEEMKSYDFSAEHAGEAYRNASPIEKYIIYKAPGCGNSDCYKDAKEFGEEIRGAYPGVEDPDSASESMLKEIYAKIWPNLYQPEDSECVCPCSDTMTSVQYIMNGYFEKEIETSEDKEYRRSISEHQQCSKNYIMNLLAKDSSCKEATEERVGHAAKRIGGKHGEGLALFLSAWHTLGNYCPIPGGFNMPRSCGGKYDFWDLTLMKIREFYHTDDEVLKERIIREDLLHCHKDMDVPACIRWLEECGGKTTGKDGWEHFVKLLCFQDWVYTEEDGSHPYYEVKPLWAGHGWGNAFLPVKWEEFFQEYHRRIRDRAEKLIEKLYP